MRPYKVLWEMHKWIGIVLSLILINVSVTGLLLLEKKQHEWIQPATRKGQEGTTAELITMQQVFDAVLDCNHPDFADVEAIDRVDFRPGKRVHKVRSKTHNAEIQVDAVTGDVLSVATRRSDMIEQLHHGSLFREWMHGKIMPAVGIANIVLAPSGRYLWLGPKCKKKKKLKQQ